MASKPAEAGGIDAGAGQHLVLDEVVQLLCHLQAVGDDACVHLLSPDGC